MTDNMLSPQNLERLLWSRRQMRKSGRRASEAAHLLKLSVLTNATMLSIALGVVQTAEESLDEVRKAAMSTIPIAWTDESVRSGVDTPDGDEDEEQWDEDSDWSGVCPILRDRAGDYIRLEVKRSWSTLGAYVGMAYADGGKIESVGVKMAPTFDQCVLMLLRDILKEE